MTALQRFSKVLDSRSTDAVVGGVIAAVVVAVVGYLGLIVVELFFATGNGLSELPPPTRWWVRLLLLAAAGAVGVVVARRELAEAYWSPRLRRRGLVLLVLIAAIVVPISAYGQYREHAYLAEVDGYAEDDLALDIGHDACDWLANRTWGEPDERDELPVPAAIQTWGVSIDSTRVWFSHYYRHVQQQQAGPLTDAELTRLALTRTAWFHLCPFQQWVHRPVGGDPDD